MAQAEFIMDQIESNPEFRDEFVASFSAELPNLSVEDAECFTDNLDATSLAAFIQMGEKDPNDMDLGSEGILAFFNILTTCDISLADLG